VSGVIEFFTRVTESDHYYHASILYFFGGIDNVLSRTIIGIICVRPLSIQFRKEVFIRRGVFLCSNNGAWNREEALVYFFSKPFFRPKVVSMPGPFVASPPTSLNARFKRWAVDRVPLNSSSLSRESIETSRRRFKQEEGEDIPFKVALLVMLRLVRAAQKRRTYRHQGR